MSKKKRIQALEDAVNRLEVLYRNTKERVEEHHTIIYGMEAEEDEILTLSLLNPKDAN